MNKVVFAEYFRNSNGKPFIYYGKELKMSDKIIQPSGEVNMKFAFLSVDSEWEQGVVLQTKGEFNIHN